MRIGKIDYHELEAQKYWSFPKSFKGDPRQETKNLIFSGDYVGAAKRDGAFYKFIKDDEGNCELIGRSKSVKGDYLDKLGWVPHLHQFFAALPNGTCLLGELYFPNNEGSNKTTTIMGCKAEKAIERQVEAPLTYYIFDILAYEGVELHEKPIEDRIEVLQGLLKFQISNIEIANYKTTGEEIWTELQSTLADGGEGIVITKKGTCYQPGKRPARQTLKVKKELQDNIDVVIIGAIPPTREYKGQHIGGWQYWQDIITGEKKEGSFYKDYFEGENIEPITKAYFNNWAGSLEVGLFLPGGKVRRIGQVSGLTEEVLSNWKKYIGKVAELTAMEITKDGALRHPRFVQWRPDKNPKECLWSQIEGL